MKTDEKAGKKSAKYTLAGPGEAEDELHRTDNKTLAQISR